MKIARPAFLLAMVLASAGCASHRTNLIARSGGQPLRMEGRSVSLMLSLHRDPQQRELDRLLTMELQRRGFSIVPQAEADFTISANTEINWVTTTTTVHPQVQANSLFVPYPGTGGFVPISTEPALVPVRMETQIPTEGIRLRLYETRVLKQGRFQTAWEGYIEAGLKLRPEQQPVLLKSLCDYLGRDFIGHVKIPK